MRSSRFLFLLPVLALWSCAPVPDVNEPAQTRPRLSPEQQQSAANKIDEIIAETKSRPAEITLRNLTAKDIVLGIKTSASEKPKMYSLPSRSKRKISLVSGQYTWAATAEKTPVQKGTKAFSSGQNYLWDFNLD